ncbi:hypothetical protein ACP70R_015036 [Stipagrostis hirtigluma subsp. patula]
MARSGKRKRQAQETPPSPLATAAPHSCTAAVQLARVPHAAFTPGGGQEDAGALVRVRCSSVAPRVTCGLCGGILRDATTVSECLHSFCRKCIYQKLSDEDIKCCPICSTNLGCAPLEKLRADRVLQRIKSMMFPAKKRKAEEISPLHPALDSLLSPSFGTRGGDHPAMKTGAYLIGEPMISETETETEATEKLGRKNSVSPTKPSASSPDRFRHLPPPITITQGGVEVEEEEIAPNLFMRKFCTETPVITTSDEGETSIPLLVSQYIFAVLTCDITYRESNLSTLPAPTHATSGPPRTVESTGNTFTFVPSSKTQDMEVEVVKETSISQGLTPDCPILATTAAPVPDQINIETQADSSSSVPPATTVTVASSPSHIRTLAQYDENLRSELPRICKEFEELKYGDHDLVPKQAMQQERNTLAKDVDTMIVIIEERKAKVATESTSSLEAQIDVRSSAALPPVASQSNSQEVEVEVIDKADVASNTARTSERVEAYIGRCQALEEENAKLRDFSDLENERAEKVVSVERTTILEERLQRESEIASPQFCNNAGEGEAYTGRSKALELENARLRLENARSEKSSASEKARLLEERLQELTERLQIELKRSQEIEAARRELLLDYYRAVESGIFKEDEQLTNLKHNNSMIEKTYIEVKQRNTVVEDQIDHVNRLLEAEKSNSIKLNEQLGKAVNEKSKLMTELKALSDGLAKIQGCIHRSLTARLSRFEGMNQGYYEDLLARINALGQQKDLPKMLEIFDIATSLSAYCPVAAMFVRLRACHGDDFDLQRLLQPPHLNKQDRARIRNAVDPLAAEVAKKYGVVMQKKVSQQ